MRLSQLNIYPLKSCRGQSLSESGVLRQGLVRDRVWLLVRPDGSQITARTHHRLVLVDALHQGNGWRFRAPSCPDLMVDPQQLREPHPAQVWKSGFTAFAGDYAADAWFSTYLGEPVRLLWLGETTRRMSDGETPLSFADGAPFLLIGEASLQDLNDRLAAAVSMRQFRPNLVVSGSFAFEEDEWQRIRIGEIEFETVKPCTRCIFTTIDPDTAIADPQQQPLRTLSAYRKQEKGVCFGINLRALNTGVLRAGDEIEVISRELAFD